MTQSAQDIVGRPDRPLPRVVVAVCTYRRNGQLRLLLEALLEVHDVSALVCSLGVVIVDDTSGHEAESVVAAFEGEFELGIHYRVSGQQNISLARNIGLEAAMTLGDWIAMTDDDCVPDPHWVIEMLEAHDSSGAMAISGPLVRRAPAGSPRWLTDQPFLQQGINSFADGADMQIGSTHNSMIATSWLLEHPDHRFDPRLGRVGGEDMVFYRTAHERGLRISFASDAVVFEDQVPERCRYRYLLKNSLWLGNSRYVTLTEAREASRLRMLVHGSGEVGRASVASAIALVRHGRPHARYALFRAVGGLGTILGVMGLRINHH